MLEQLREKLSDAGAEALLVTRPANVRYLSGFRSPQDGRVLVTLEDAWLITDGRYTAQAGEESRLGVEIVPKDWPAFVAERVGSRRLAFESDSVNYDLFETLNEKLPDTPIPTKGLVSELRLRKTPQEIGTLREAARLTDAGFTHILDFIRAGAREVEVALELERFLRLSGAEGTSFETIVASGARSAMPHGVASNKTIETGDLVTLDFGAKLDGYHADMTRTVAVGSVNGKLREMYDAVLRAQEGALHALAPGKTGGEMDAVARASLTEAGLGENFTHSLGHGVGLEIHEGPRLARDQEERLEPSMTVTIEPGVYLPGEAGVRIEDLTVITEGGYERLSESPKEFLQL